MDFQDLKIFKQLYLQRNITAVSKTLFMSQPSVSYRLRKIQEELGVALYEFDGAYHFNERSKVFFDYCIKVLNSFDITADKLHKDQRYTVSLSTISTSLYQSAIFRKCLELNQYPSIRTCTSDEAVLDVLENRSRIAIVGGVDIELTNTMEIIHLYSEKILFVYNSECSGDLSDTPLVLDQPNSGIRKGIEEYIQNYSNVKIIGEVGITSHRLQIINEHHIGMFIQEKYLTLIHRLKNIYISEEVYFNHHVSLLAKKSELQNSVTSELIEYLNTI